MSSVDVARAFNVPMVTVEKPQHQMHVDKLLREVSSRNIHHQAARGDSSVRRVASFHDCLG